MHVFINIIKFISYLVAAICILEFILRWKKYKHNPAIPVFRKLRKQITESYKRYYPGLLVKLDKILQYSGLKTIAPDSCGEKSPTQIAPVLEYTLITSLRELPLNTFITCSVDSDYTVLGDAPADILENAWIKLLSAFYEAKEDVNARKYVEISREMAAIELRQRMINTACNAMVLYPTKRRKNDFAELGYPFDFLPETMENDLQMILNKEKVHDIRLKQLRTDFKNIQGGKTEKKSAESFYEIISVMNETWKTSYSVDRMNALEYAVNVKRLEKHIENLNNR